MYGASVSNCLHVGGPRVVCDLSEPENHTFFRQSRGRLKVQHVTLYIYVSTSVYVCMYVCMYVCIYVYIGSIIEFVVYKYSYIAHTSILKRMYSGVKIETANRILV